MKQFRSSLHFVRAFVDGALINNQSVISNCSFPRKLKRIERIGLRYNLFFKYELQTCEHFVK